MPVILHAHPIQWRGEPAWRYGRAVLNNWRAWADAQISSITPRGKSLFWDSTSITAGARFGSAYGRLPYQTRDAIGRLVARSA